MNKLCKELPDKSVHICGEPRLIVFHGQDTRLVTGGNITINFYQNTSSNELDTTPRCCSIPPITSLLCRFRINSEDLKHRFGVSWSLEHDAVFLSMAPPDIFLSSGRPAPPRSPPRRKTLGKRLRTSFLRAVQSSAAEAGARAER